MKKDTVFGGLRVVEFADGMAGAMAGMVLADNGAEVIKVETPEGDWARSSPGFPMWNRGKRGLVFDFGKPGDVSSAIDLAAGADIVIESSDALDRLPATAQLRSLRDRASKLIYCAITTFGRVESLNRLPRYDGLVMAKTGRLFGNDEVSGSRYAPERPVFLATPTGSYGAAMLAVQGISAALIDRRKTGLGQLVETSLLEGMLAATMRLRFKREGDGLVRSHELAAHDVKHAGIMLTFLTALCSDGRYIQMCARQDHHFRGWLRAMGLEKLLEEERFKNAPLGMKKMEDVEELKKRFEARMREKPYTEWMRMFVEEFDVGSDPFLTPDEFMAHPQMMENGRVVEINDAERGKTREVGPIAVMNDTPSRIERGAPRLGADQASLAQLLAARDRPANATVPAKPRDKAPLAGKTIIELAYFLAGPLGPTLVAELGARVIKIEPPTGDSFRRVGIDFAHLVNGKESVALDLKTPQGLEILHKLVKDADALLHNFRPGVPERLGWGYETLAEINPRLVFVCGASYGSKGPWSRRPAFHSTPNAMSGGGIAQGGEGQPPIDDSYPDPVAGLAVATALTMGLNAQELTGKGQYIETTMLCSSAYAHSERMVRYDGVRAIPPLDSEQRGLNAVQRLYPTAEGWWLYLGIGREVEWQRFCTAVSHPEWLDQYRFDDIRQRAGNSARLADELDRLFKGKDAARWEATLQEADVPAVKLGDSVEQFFMDHKLVDAAQHPDYGSYFRLPVRVRMTGNRHLVRRPASLGEHSRPVLAEFGYSDEQINQLEAAGVIKTGGG